MSEVKHTPGPWEYGLGDDLVVTSDDGFKAVAEVLDHTVFESISRHEADANARLIAASPSLYEALSDLLGIIRESQGVAGYHLNGNVADWGEFDDLIGNAEVALSKATLKSGGDEQ